MKISIITATYNSSRFIESTYQSIRKQTYTDWEWVVTDDCSADDTYDLLLNISANDSRVKIFRLERNSGAAVARNNSIDNAEGEYLAFLDSDDEWHDKKISTQYEIMTNKGLDFTFTAYEVISEHGAQLHLTVDTKNAGFFSYKDMLKKKATLGCSTVMLKSSLLSGLRMPLLRTGQDYAFWLAILKLGTQAYCIDTPLTLYRISAGSISRNKFKKAKRQWKIYRELEKLPLFYAIECFCYYAVRAVFRRS
ncbi:glycosyltransferase family 2 protein [Vibrio metschnikovii]|nr:glycosyltransferase family 2 protein [Vibrio metschnikovii]